VIDYGDHMVVDCLDQVGHVGEGTAAQAVLGEITEEPLDHIEP
jgi:hypothetical protein